jgi:hypothetical protein
VTEEEIGDDWPLMRHALEKAESDPFMYAMGLKSGRQVKFESAEVVGEWVNLRGVTWHDIYDAETQVVRYGEPRQRGKFAFDRGLSVRLDAIEWVSDAGGYDS